MSIKKEFESINEKLYPEDTKNSTVKNQNIRIRFEQSVKWYIKKANYNKMMFYFLSILEIVFPGIIIILNCASDYWELPYKLIITILSVLSTFTASMLSLFKFHKKWMHYRFVAETLQTQFSLYLGQVGAYNETEDNRDKLFVSITEEIMRNELFDWKDIVKTIKINTPKEG